MKDEQIRMRSMVTLNSLIVSSVSEPETSAH